MLFHLNNLVSGIDIGHYAVKYVCLGWKHSTIRLIKAGHVKINNNSEVKRNKRVKKALNQLKGTLGKKHGKVVSAVDNENLIIKKMCIPIMEKEAIIETIRWEFSEYVPFSLDNSVIDYIVTSENQEEMEITAVIVPRTAVDNTLAFLENFSINSLNIQPFALLNIFKLKGITEPIMIIDLGEKTTQIIVGGKNNIYLMRNLDIGVKDLNIQSTDTKNNSLVLVQEKGYSKTYYSGDQETKTPLKELKIEINRAVNFFTKKSGSKNVKGIYLSGGGVYLADIRERLSKNLNLNFKFTNPFHNLTWSPNRIENLYQPDGCLAEYAVATGLCISEVLANES
jgi:type IV pilus assembly protein PilM